MKSLKSRLLLGTAFGTVVAFGTAGVLIYEVVEAWLWRGFDQSLAAEARGLSGLIEFEDGQLAFEHTVGALGDYESSTGPAYFQFWLDGGATLARSRSLGTAALQPIAGTLDAPQYRSGPLPDGQPGRLVGVSFTPRVDAEPGGGTVQELPPSSIGGRKVDLTVARHVAPVTETLGKLGTLLIMSSTLGCGLSLVLLTWSTRRSVRPISDLTTQINEIGDWNLSHRVQLAGAPSELVPIARRLNELLGRLESAFSRERAFTEDVAHELRTPLTGLRATLELGLSRERSAPAYRECLDDSLAVAVQMQRMVEDLLLLARADAGVLQLFMEDVRVADLMLECWSQHAAVARARRLRVEWDLCPAARVHTDEGKLRIVILNLLENAVAYADEGGTIAIQSTADAEAVTLSVANTGCLLAQDQVDRVFDRFWRGDSSRGDTSHHSGLGLAICNKVVGALGGAIHATRDEEGTFRVSVTLRHNRRAEPAPAAAATAHAM